MSDPLHASSPTCAQTLRALSRYPDRTAFAWPGGSLSYQGTIDLIGRIQGVFMRLGLQPGARVAFLTANRADTWCAGVAAQLSRLCVTWLHPLGSLADQLFQLEDSEAEMLVVDAAAFRDRGGELAVRALRLKAVFTMGPAGYGVDLLAAIESAGRASARNLASLDDLSTLNYTGGTTGKSKGALRYHRENAGAAGAILADFEIPDAARYLAVAPISHVAGTKVLPTLMRGGTVHMLKGFDPEAVLTTIARERINFTLFVPTMIYVLLDILRLIRPTCPHSSWCSTERRRCRRAGWSRASNALDRCSRSSMARPNAIRSRYCARRITIRRRRSCSCPAVSRSQPARSRSSTTTTAR
jgi:fatty-acyl-CoA synthase